MGKCLSTVPSIEQTEVWAGNLSDGYYVVLLFNKASFENTVEVTWEEVGLNSTKASARNLWTKEDLGIIDKGYKVKLQSHDSLLLKVKPETSPDPKPEPEPELEPEPEPEPKPEPKPNPDENNVNNTIVFSLTIGCLCLVILFIFFIICYMKKKRENLKKAENNDIEDENLNDKLVRNTTDSQN